MLTEVGFDSGRWTFRGGPAMRALAGSDTVWAVPDLALLRDVAFEDGVIEVDMYGGAPAFVFHAESPDDHEIVYLRTPMSGRAEALQYSPVFRGFLPWRLYGGAQAAATFDTAGGPNARTRVRAVVRGREVRVYVNSAASPQLVATLRHTARGGAVGVRNVAGPGAPPMRFARFRYAAEPRAGADAAPAPAVLPGAVTRWELSSVLVGGDVDTYANADSTRPWQPVIADFDGLVNVSRYSGVFVSEGRPAPVAARAILTRERAGSARLAFAYCDRAAVFLNGRRVFSGRLPMSRGREIMPRLAARDTVALDLRAGANELVVVSTGETFHFGHGGDGGWGFAARLVPDGSDGAGRTSEATRAGGASRLP